jgi:hypothetical protein
LNSDPSPTAATIAVAVFGADALDLCDALAHLTVAEYRIDLPVEDDDAAVEVAEEIIEFVECFASEHSYLVLDVRQYLRNYTARSGDALADSEPTIEQEASNLADDSGPVIDHPLPRTMQRLNILLFDALLGDEGNVGLTCGRTNGLGIITIVLLPSHERLHILRTDDLHLVPELLKFTSPVECSGTCLDNNRASLDLSDHFQKLIAHDPPFEYDPATAVHTVKLEYIFGDIDAENLNAHCSSPCCCRLSA